MVTAYIGLPLVAGLTKWNLVESFTLVDQAKKKAPAPACFPYGHSVSGTFGGDCNSVRKGLLGRDLSVGDFYGYQYWFPANWKLLKFDPRKEASCAHF